MLKKIWGWVKVSFSLAEEDCWQFSRRGLNQAKAKYGLTFRLAEQGLGKFDLPAQWVKERALMECVTNETYGLGYKE